MQIPYSVLQAVREWFFKQACSSSRQNLHSFDFWACAVMLRLYAANSSNKTAIARTSTSSQCTLTYAQFPSRHGNELIVQSSRRPIVTVLVSSFPLRTAVLADTGESFEQIEEKRAGRPTAA